MLALPTPALTSSLLQAAPTHVPISGGLYTVWKKRKFSQCQKSCASGGDPVCCAAGEKRPQQLRPRAALKQPPATTPLPLAGRMPARRPLQMSRRSRCSFAHAITTSALCVFSPQAFDPTKTRFGSGPCLDVPLAGGSANLASSLGACCMLSGLGL